MFGIRLDILISILEKMKECRSRVMTASQRLQETQRSMQTLAPTDDIRKSLRETGDMLEAQSGGLSRCICSLEHIITCVQKAEEKAIGYSEGNYTTHTAAAIGMQDVVRLEDSNGNLQVRFRE